MKNVTRKNAALENTVLEHAIPQGILGSGNRYEIHRYILATRVFVYSEATCPRNPIESQGRSRARDRCSLTRCGRFSASTETIPSSRVGAETSTEEGCANYIGSNRTQLHKGNVWACGIVTTYGIIHLVFSGSWLAILATATITGTIPATITLFLPREIVPRGTRNRSLLLICIRTLVIRHRLDTGTLDFGYNI